MVYAKNQYLTRKEMTVNAQWIMNYLTKNGFTKNAVAGILGNMESESTINPGLWEGFVVEGKGYGLTQWTPWTKITNYLESKGLPRTSIKGQCDRIIGEFNGTYEQWYSKPNYPMTAKEFKKSKKSPTYLAEVFINNYERPQILDQPIRGVQAEYWYKNLSANGSSGGGYEVALFPMDYIYITQGENGEYSHRGSLCIDFVGTTPNYPYYAPCSCTCIYVDTSQAIVIWKSDNKVMCADGEVRNIVWDCIHDNVMSHKVGMKLKQGDLMGYTGTGGNVTGDHLHLNVINGTKFQGFSGTAPHYRLTGTELHIYDVFAIQVNTEIANGLNYDWKTTDYDGSSGSGNENPPQKDKEKTIIDFLMLDVLNGWKY